MRHDWRQLIDEALPRRELGVDRAAVINCVVKEIEKWKEIEPEIEPHAAKTRQVTAVAKRLGKALKVADETLAKLGVGKDIEQARARLVALGINPEKGPLRGQSAALDLYLVTWRASDEIRNWNRIYRRPSQRPLEFRVSLTKQLQSLLCKQVGCSAGEFEKFLEISEQPLWLSAGLPKLAASTLKKRKQRAKKKARRQTS
jgi:hypothetical protein